MELTSREAEKVKLTLEKAKEFSDREVQLQVRRSHCEVELYFVGLLTRDHDDFDDDQAQLNSYSEKFDVVQETLTKSNQMFTTFREEMDKVRCGNYVNHERCLVLSDL